MDIGECWLSRHYDSETMGYRLQINRADPRILVCKEFLAELLAQPTDMAYLDGDLMHIKTREREIVYRIGEFDADYNAYTADMFAEIKAS